MKYHISLDDTTAVSLCAATSEMSPKFQLVQNALARLLAGASWKDHIPILFYEDSTGSQSVISMTKQNCWLLPLNSYKDWDQGTWQNALVNMILFSHWDI